MELAAPAFWLVTRMVPLDDGGDITMLAGNAKAGTGDGGSFTLKTGTSAVGVTGAITIETGTSTHSSGGVSYSR